VTGQFQWIGRWKEAKRIQMGRPNRDMLGPDLE
jgi:hypothetical protein